MCFMRTLVLIHFEDHGADRIYEDYGADVFHQDPGAGMFYEEPGNDIIYEDPGPDMFYEDSGAGDSGVPTCDGMSQNRGLGTVSQSVPRSVSSSVTASSPLSSAGPAASGSTNSIDSSRSALTSNGPVLDQIRPDQIQPRHRSDKTQTSVR